MHRTRRFDSVDHRDKVTKQKRRNKLKKHEKQRKEECGGEWHVKPASNSTLLLWRPSTLLCFLLLMPKREDHTNFTLLHQPTHTQASHDHQPCDVLGRGFIAPLGGLCFASSHFRLWSLARTARCLLARRVLSAATQQGPHTSSSSSRSRSSTSRRERRCAPVLLAFL